MSSSERPRIVSLSAEDISETPKDLQAEIADIKTKLEDLAATMTATQAQLRDLLLQTREQLLRRDDEIQATIYDLGTDLDRPVQPSVAMSPPTVEGGVSVTLQPPGYTDLVNRIRTLVAATVQPGSTVIVTSRGDEQLLEFENAQGWHFPQAPNGVYAGFHPHDSESAIQQLEELRSRGGAYFLLPETAAWWFDYYRGFRDHLESHYSVVARERDACVLYSLTDRRPARESENQRP